MKKLIVCLTLACLASIPVGLAGDVKASAKSGSTGKTKATSSAKSECSEKTDCSASAKAACAEKSSCCEKEITSKKVSKPDVKGATFLVKR